MDKTVKSGSPSSPLRNGLRWPCPLVVDKITIVVRATATNIHLMEECSPFPPTCARLAMWSLRV